MEHAPIVLLFLVLLTIALGLCFGFSESNALAPGEDEGESKARWHTIATWDEEKQAYVPVPGYPKPLNDKAKHKPLDRGRGRP